MWDKVFDNFGIKKVTKTDKNKEAYVPNGGQKSALKAAGKDPDLRSDIELIILGDFHTNKLVSSYYSSVRAASAGRSPEERMGKELIADWLDIGDEVVIGNIGSEVYAAKNIIGFKGIKAIVEQAAKEAKKKPKKSKVLKDEFERNPMVVKHALLRANGKCEMPGCTTALFKKPNGEVYLEVHHIEYLSENGDDSVENVAALCASCHRELHYGDGKDVKKKKLIDSMV
ncbi:HNH endonuclease signature motif containing protein [Ferrimonas sp. SCSIO 43195]|uniref:HNH endonuclease n=1 Tax=Ferrimonas sp. SCSIO 43195 TaxID=2822844 RepID=UPI0020750B9A|nr:HNH endonuclease signature motif containing protein [Ferrimonas sp. SCSIO 43195]USD38004.1 HNH endonuclease [Ferrimonas sp. SCSIO 43195]